MLVGNLEGAVDKLKKGSAMELPATCSLPHYIGSISEAARGKEIAALASLAFQRREKNIYLLMAPSYTSVI